MHIKQRCRKQSCTSLSQQELFAGFAYQTVRTPSLQSFVLKRSAVLSRPVLFATAFMSLFSLVIAFCKVRREGRCEKASSEGLSNDHGPLVCSWISPCFSRILLFVDPAPRFLHQFLGTSIIPWKGASAAGALCVRHVPSLEVKQVMRTFSKKYCSSLELWSLKGL
jgi:hypothetical protein